MHLWLVQKRGKTNFFILMGVSWSKLNTSWTVLHFSPLRLFTLKNTTSLICKTKIWLVSSSSLLYEFFGLPEWFLPFQRRQQKAHTTHKKGENKSWASAAAFAGRLLLECLTFTPIKILFLTYLLKVSPHKLNGPAHNELKRRKKFILVGQCTVCLKG